MNILFLTSPVPKITPMYVGEKLPPMGIAMLMSLLKRRGHKVYFRDEYLAPTDTLDGTFLADKAIDFVGIYANTICFDGTLSLLDKLRTQRAAGWKGKIMMGGPHTSVAVDTIPDDVDYIVQGEGENAIIDIVENAIKPGIIRGEQVMDLDSLPIPAWEELIFQPYSWRDPFATDYPVYNMNTSRGCPFDCSFCSVNACWGRTYRAMSAERVVEEIEYLKRYYGARAIFFREDHFTLKRSRTEAFCELMLTREIDVKWLCEARFDSLRDPSFLKLLKRAGCDLLYLGAESGSQRMLDYFRKGITVEAIEEGIAMLREAGIRSYASFIVGVPYETDDDRQKTEALIKRAKPDFVGRNPYVGLPGSDVYREVRAKEQYVHENPYGVLYVNGHDERVDQYWGGQERYKVPRIDARKTE